MLTLAHLLSMVGRFAKSDRSSLRPSSGGLVSRIKRVSALMTTVKKWNSNVIVPTALRFATTVDSAS